MDGYKCTEMGDGGWLLLAGEERYAETEGKEEFRQACLWDYSDVIREDRNQTDTFLLTATLCQEKLSVVCITSIKYCPLLFYLPSDKSKETLLNTRGSSGASWHPYHFAFALKLLLQALLEGHAREGSLAVNSSVAGGSVVFAHTVPALAKVTVPPILLS